MTHDPHASKFSTHLSGARLARQNTMSNRLMYVVLLVMAAGLLLLSTGGYRTGHLPDPNGPGIGAPLVSPAVTPAGTPTVTPTATLGPKN